MPETYIEITRISLVEARAEMAKIGAILGKIHTNFSMPHSAGIECSEPEAKL